MIWPKIKAVVCLLCFLGGYFIFLRLFYKHPRKSTAFSLWTLLPGAAGGLGAMACCIRYSDVPAQGILAFAVMCVLAAGALTDWDTGKIPNRVSVLLFLCGTAAIWVFPQVTVGHRVVGCLLVSVPMFLLALLFPTGFGGGDIKLMFSAGWLLGWRNMLCAAFLSVVTGGCYGLYLLVTRKATGKDTMRFGPFLCVSIAAALLWGDSLLTWYFGL